MQLLRPFDIYQNNPLHHSPIRLLIFLQTKVLGFQVVMHPEFVEECDGLVGFGSETLVAREILFIDSFLGRCLVGFVEGL